MILPKLAFAQLTLETFFGKVTGVCDYWAKVFNFSLAASGVITVAVLALGGLYYMISLGDQEKIGRAKDVMTGAIAGFLLLLLGFTIFYTLSPRLTTCKIEVAFLELPGEALPEELSFEDVGPVAPSDPCAGVPDEKLFSTKEECQTKGGEKGGECQGACLESNPPPLQKDESQTPSPESPSPTPETTATQNPRAGKYCCVNVPSPTACAEVAKTIPVAGSNDKAGLLKGGIIDRNCPGRWCYKGPPPEPSGLPPACSTNTSPQVVVNPNICQVLLALKGAGFKPSVYTIIRNHSRCVGKYGMKGCTPPEKCRESPHWDGGGVDINIGTEMQRYIRDNLYRQYGLMAIIGPAEEYNCRGAKCPFSYDSFTMKNHQDHIHLSFPH